jgi:hypothetical protein
MLPFHPTNHGGPGASARKRHYRDAAGFPHAALRHELGATLIKPLTAGHSTKVHCNGPEGGSSYKRRLAAR